MQVLVIGGSGLVGANIVDAVSTSDDEVCATYNRSKTPQTDIQLDKTDTERVQTIISDIDPDVVIDTAAFHAVDDCEHERTRAWSVNAMGTRNVATATDEVGAHFIFLSSDYVFPGQPSEAPYRESDPVLPINYYARTKYAGEQAAQIAETATVLRPSVIYGKASENFVTWALGELEDSNTIDIVDDQVSSPTYAPDLARACIEVARRDLPGLYHAAGSEQMSRYDFTRTLADVFGYEKELVSPISTAEFGQEAQRPADSSLDSTRLYDDIDYEFRQPKEAFEDLRLKYRQNM
jgi:dTDP-4-dehydrorhamnose reductase